MKVFSGKLINKKRGSLELSINAIVILVMAITLLALGLGFIRKIFTGVGDKLLTIEPEELQNPASSDNPISLETGKKLLVKQGISDKDIAVSVYNTKTSTAVGAFLELTGCIGANSPLKNPTSYKKADGTSYGATEGATANTEVTAPSLDVSPQDIDAGEVAGFIALLSAGDYKRGKYLCTVKSVSEASIIDSKQITLEISS